MKVLFVSIGFSFHSWFSNALIINLRAVPFSVRSVCACVCEWVRVSVRRISAIVVVVVVVSYNAIASRLIHSGAAYNVSWSRLLSSSSLDVGCCRCTVWSVFCAHALMWDIFRRLILGNFQYVRIRRTRSHRLPHWLRQHTKLCLYSRCCCCCCFACRRSCIPVFYITS